ARAHGVRGHVHAHDDPAELDGGGERDRAARGQRDPRPRRHPRRARAGLRAGGLRGARAAAAVRARRADLAARRQARVAFDAHRGRAAGDPVGPDTARPADEGRATMTKLTGPELARALDRRRYLREQRARDVFALVSSLPPTFRGVLGEPVPPLPANIIHLLMLSARELEWFTQNVA